MKQALKATIVYCAIVAATLAAIEIGSFAALVAYGWLGKGLPLREAIAERVSLHPWSGSKKYVTTGFNPLTQNSPVPSTQWTGLKVNSEGYVGNGTNDPMLNTYPQKPEGLLRVVLLGGSSAAGVTAKDNTETIPAHLERQLNAAVIGKKFQVLNFGVPGGYLFSDLARYASHVAHIDPDIVICFDGYNDALYAAFEQVRQRLDVPVMNWADYSYQLFDTMNNIGGVRRGGPPAIFTYAFVVARILLDRIGTGDASEAYYRRRAQFYADNFVYRFSKSLRQDNPYYGNAIYQNLNLLASAHIGRRRLFIAYLQAMPLEFKDLSAELKDGLDLLRAPVSEAKDPEKNALFRNNLVSAFHEYAKIYERLDKELAAFGNIRFRDIRRIFENTKERVYNDIIHTNSLGNAIIAAQMRRDIEEMLPHLTVAR